VLEQNTSVRGANTKKNSADGNQYKYEDNNFIYYRQSIMFRGNRILFVVKIKNMTITECPRCFGRALFYGADGKSRCVVCNPYKEDK
jgi:hypothetical protein